MQQTELHTKLCFDQYLYLVKNQFWSMNRAYHYFWKIFDKTCPMCDVRRPSTELWIQVSKPNIFPTLSLHRLPLEQPQNRLLTQTHHIKQQVCHIVELLNNQVSNQKILSFFNRQYIPQMKEIILCIFIDDAGYCIITGFVFYIISYLCSTFFVITHCWLSSVRLKYKPCDLL